MMTLPESAKVNDRDFAIIKLDAAGNTVTVDVAGNETISVLANFVRSSRTSLAGVRSNGSGWPVISWR